MNIDVNDLTMIKADVNDADVIANVTKVVDDCAKMNNDLVINIFIN